MTKWARSKACSRPGYDLNQFLVDLWPLKCPTTRCVINLKPRVSAWIRLLPWADVILTKAASKAPLVSRVSKRFVTFETSTKSISSTTVPKDSGKAKNNQLISLIIKAFFAVVSDWSASACQNCPKIATHWSAPTRLIADGTPWKSDGAFVWPESVNVSDVWRLSLHEVNNIFSFGSIFGILVHGQGWLPSKSQEVIHICHGFFYDFSQFRRERVFLQLQWFSTLGFSIITWDSCTAQKVFIPPEVVLFIFQGTLKPLCTYRNVEECQDPSNFSFLLVFEGLEVNDKNVCAQWKVVQIDLSYRGHHFKMLKNKKDRHWLVPTRLFHSWQTLETCLQPRSLEVCGDQRIQLCRSWRWARGSKVRPRPRRDSCQRKGDFFIKVQMLENVHKFTFYISLTLSEQWLFQKCDSYPSIESLNPLKSVARSCLCTYKQSNNDEWLQFKDIGFTVLAQDTKIRSPTIRLLMVGLDQKGRVGDVIVKIICQDSGCAQPGNLFQQGHDPFGSGSRIAGHISLSEWIHRTWSTTLKVSTIFSWARPI